jgi:hypothetical protein
VHNPVVTFGHGSIRHPLGQACGESRIVISDNHAREASRLDIRKGKTTKGRDADDTRVFLEAVHEVDNPLHGRVACRHLRLQRSEQGRTFQGHRRAEFTPDDAH